MKSFETLSEDLATRRAELKQRQREQGSRFKQKSAAMVDTQKQRSSDAQKRAADDSKAALDRIKQRAAAKAAADRARKVKQKERDDISKEIAASREQKKDDIEQKRDERKDDIKAREKKRMSKERSQVTPDTVG